ncbi:MAG TPA: cyanophycin synthetase [Solirubrobacteraceae bacterium]|jgi:dihydrofolate synthase/folylpolyglutamate synthase|nr:cyanophycin synthetase [Solirubrobacteraceae bacterium]
MSQDWSPEHAARHLRSLELFGMRFGLDRMHRMMTVLGSPERSFDSIHVVGTNGKSSTTRMTAAILERHGLRSGCYLSPHLLSYSERVQIAEHDVETHAFAAAIARAAWAAERVNRTLAEDDHVTQFELLTAAAFWELARRGAQVVVVEAGLGGRYDATNVIDSKVAVLTNVGLEHTRWLGPTLTDIATEKLAVLGEHSVLALGSKLQPEVLALARRVVAERGGELLVADPAPEDLQMRARGSFQRENFALARLAAESYLQQSGIALSEQAVQDAAISTSVAGRMQILGEDPLTVLDGAHNPAAITALVESLPELLDGRPLALVFGVLEDKDAASMLRELLPLCERAWFTAPPSQRALSPATLQSLAGQLGFEQGICESQPAKALAAAREWAREHGAAVLATGSVYLVGDLFAHADELGLDTAAMGLERHDEQREQPREGGGRGR